MSMVRLVLYGTLRKGQPRHKALPTSKGKMVGVEKIREYIMVALPYGFPGVYRTNNKDDSFSAEIWEFNLSKPEKETLLNRLDELEGVKYGMYSRTIIDLPNVGEAFMYVCHMSSKNGKIINDWGEYTRSKA